MKLCGVWKGEGHVARASPISAMLFQSVLSSIQNRLLHLHAQLTDSVQELTRLIMLAFLTTKFKLPGIQIPYTWLVDEIPKVYAHVNLFVLAREQSLVM